MGKAHILSGSGIVLAAALAGLAPGGQAQAADMLRGPYAGDQQPSRTAVADWGGIYAGVHVGASVGTADPRRFASTHRNALTASPAMPASIAATVSGMVGLRDTSATKFSYGAFIGANWQWDDVVLGIEGDYTRSDLRLRNSTTSAQTYSPAAGTEYDLRVTSTSNVRVQDWATLRARIGWSAGMFMPYITGGFALGSVRSQTSANAAWDRYSTVVLPRPYPQRHRFWPCDRRGHRHAADARRFPARGISQRPLQQQHDAASGLHPYVQGGRRGEILIIARHKQQKPGNAGLSCS